MNTQRLARGTDEKKWQDSLLLFPQIFHPVPRQFYFYRESAVHRIDAEGVASAPSGSWL